MQFTLHDRGMGHDLTRHVRHDMDTPDRVIPVRFLERLVLVVSEQHLDAVLDTIVRSARTGAIGDGKIWVTTVDHVIRIRTGEEDLAAV